MKVHGPGLLESWKFIREWTVDRITPMEELAERYGDIVQLRLGVKNIFVLNHPDLVEEMFVGRHKDFHKDRYNRVFQQIMGNGLFSSEEKFHLCQRRMIQPAFHKERLLEYGTHMVAAAGSQLNKWGDQEEVDLYQCMVDTTLDITAKTLFNSDVSDDSRAISESVGVLIGFDTRIVMPFGTFILHLPLPSNRPFFEHRKRINEVVYRLIDEHRSKDDQGDFLSLLLRAEDQDDGHRMTREQVRDEAVSLLLASHETTAIALTYAFYLLALNPEALKKVEEEIQSVFKGEAPDAAKYADLHYTRAAFAEAMRLYPPAFTLARESIRDTTLGGHKIPKGSMCVASPYIVQRDERFFPDSTRFNPDRWLGGACRNIPKFAYFPFGGGNRVCIGESFVWMEGVLVIATILQQWRMRLPDSFELRFDPHITLRPKPPVPIRLERREIPV